MSIENKFLESFFVAESLDFTRLIRFQGKTNGKISADNLPFVI